jgi:predicted HAD superfamily Cof-like phosphohydrolase
MSTTAAAEPSADPQPALQLPETIVTPQRQVAQFHALVSTQADPPTLRREGFPGELRCALIEEEAREFREAAEAKDPVEMVDALCDLLYVVYGAACQLGVDLDPFFQEVHRTNMAKGPAAGGYRRADGKWMKPAGWQPPRIAHMLKERYGYEATAGV